MRIKSWQLGLLSLLATILAIFFTLQIQHRAFRSPASTSTILVAAAASLQKALQEITPLYTNANATQPVNYNFAASGALQQQIERGAPVDVFISAADKQMNELKAKELLVAGTYLNLLTNKLVLIVPKQSTLKITNFQQLDRSQIQRIAIGEPRTVPAGQYATEVFKSLGIFNRVKSKFILASNVRAVLTAVETGDVDAGIVYLTDARSSDKIEIVAIANPKLHAPIKYSIAVLKSSKLPAASKQYIDFLQSKSARAIFIKYGFGVAES
ncbi:molybdate ABC transporter substrate-binding protein [Chamaesiphon sp. VAR_48_metabat_403]|uniref:molybdate ABC transporter substrate-binding protein n=1 Tax=Chamaesiphon sp. VAR_48_metabat_403 TaxID=2964700 RepID=UPI00286DE18E|nr:molybdate ABC transporter substrate-binding protein [Chamaesiphon sp. VAR_48_metabat_403]